MVIKHWSNTCDRSSCKTVSWIEICYETTTFPFVHADFDRPSRWSCVCGWVRAIVIVNHLSLGVGIVELEEENFPASANVVSKGITSLHVDSVYHTYKSICDSGARNDARRRSWKETAEDVWLGKMNFISWFFSRLLKLCKLSNWRAWQKWGFMNMITTPKRASFWPLRRFGAGHSCSEFELNWAVVI